MPNRTRKYPYIPAKRHEGRNAMEFKKEFIEKAKSAASAEELLALAEKYNIEMTAEEANEYFTQLHPKRGELSDDELDNVAGGGCEGCETSDPVSKDQGLYAGRLVYLCNSGHTSGHTCCMNSVCGSNVFRIQKQIAEDKYLLGCMGCDWTYHAFKENIKAL